MQRLKEIIIIGGGSSIKEGIAVGLKDKIANKCVLGTNYSFKHFDLTALCFIDRDFYRPLHMKQHKDATPDVYEELGKLNYLIIGGRRNPDLDNIAHKNTILIPCPKKQLGECPPLTGIFALAIADYFNPENIFLLGYDWDRRNPATTPRGKYYRPTTDRNTHYYDDVKHKGNGFLGFYENHIPENYFKYFTDSTSKIYNVSLKSNINMFEKIDYSKMFELLSPDVCNKEELQKFIRSTLLN